MSDLSIVFNYQIQKTGNGLQTTIPNFKEDGYILHCIEFSVPVSASPASTKSTVSPEIEVTVSHSGTNQKFGTSYFQIFNKISLSDYWYRLADGDRVELSVKNKSTRVIDLTVTYLYKSCRGILINCSSMRAGDLKDSTLLEDLCNGGSLLTDLYLKSPGMGSLKLVPKFQSDGEVVVYNMDIMGDETVLDFTGEDLVEIRSLLGYYSLEIDFKDPDQTVYILAYGFKK